MNVNDYIWRSLKSRGGSAFLLEIVADVNRMSGITWDKAQIEAILDGMVEYIERDKTRFTIRIFLDPPLKKQVRVKGWDWEKIQEKKGLIRGAEPVKASGVYESPYQKYLPWFEQGSVGSCVGHSAGYWAMANYLSILTREGKNILPSPIVMAEARRNQTTIVNGKCTMKYDQWYIPVPSPGYLYRRSRDPDRGNVTHPSGSWTWAAAMVLKLDGWVLWNECLTPKTSMCTPRYFPKPVEELNQLAAAHKFDGYAEVKTWEGIKRAIAESEGRGVLSAIDLYEDYMTPDVNGNLRVHVGQESVGGHALWFCKVDWDNDRIGFRNSWGTARLPEAWVTKKYWQEMGDSAFVSLDGNETLIGKQLYMKVRFSSNCSTRFYVDGEEQFRETDFTASSILEVGQVYSVKAVPSDTTKWSPVEIVKNVTVVQQSTPMEIPFIFTDATTPEPPVPPIPPDDNRTWFQKIMDKIKKIFGR